MEGISDIKIIGIDECRPPVIRKEPYIDLFFKLAHKAPMDWCNDLNFLMSNLPGTPKININDGLYIESWVKTPDDIEDFLENLKIKVTQCSEEYIQRIELAASKAQDANESLEEEQGEQGRLNRIIASLNYDEVSTQ